MTSSDRSTALVATLAVWFASGCGAQSEREVRVCRSAWRELSIPDEFRDFRAGAAVWIGGRLFLLGAEVHAGTPAPEPKGLAFEPPTRFAPISETGAPTFALLEATVATGTSILVFSDRGFEMGRYDTASDSWAALPPIGLEYSDVSNLVPLPEQGALIGVEVGTGDASVTRYFAYDANGDTWREASSPPEEPLYGWSGVWTGEDVVVGGVAARGNEEAWVGARYSPSSDTWTALPEPTDMPALAWFPRVWTGSQVIASGIDLANPDEPVVLARYRPERDAWDLASDVGQPAGSPESVVAVGTRVLSWNAIAGAAPEDYERDSGLYDPETDSWSSVPETCGPETRVGQLLTWTGAELIAWGGSCPDAPSEQCEERAWSLPGTALFGESPDDPSDCRCP